MLGKKTSKNLNSNNRTNAVPFTSFIKPKIKKEDPITVSLKMPPPKMIRNGKFLKSSLDTKEGAQKASVQYWSLWQHSHLPEDSKTYIRQYLTVTPNFPLLLLLMLKYQHHCTQSFPPDVWAIPLRKISRNCNSTKSINLLQLPASKQIFSHISILTFS